MTFRLKIWPLVKARVKDLATKNTCIKFQHSALKPIGSTRKKLLWHWEWIFELASESRWKTLFQGTLVSSFNSLCWELLVLLGKICCDLENENLTLGQGQGERPCRKKHLCKVSLIWVENYMFYKEKFVVTLTIEIWPCVKVKVKDLVTRNTCVKY